MSRNRQPVQCLALISAVVAAVVVPGCVTLDPTADVERASSLVTSRAGASTGWTTPWYVPSSAWDGRADLSVDAAVRTALQNNRSIRRQVETIAGARADLVQAHLLPNPVINLAFGFPTDGLGGEPLSAGVVQQLAALWRRPVAIDAAEAELRAQVLAVSDEGLRLVARTRAAHARVVFAEEAAQLQERNIDLLRDTERLLRDRFDVGEASRLDLNRVALDLEAAAIRLTDRRSTLARSKRDLLEILGRSDAAVSWHAVVDDRPIPDAAALDELLLIDLAAVQRLDVAAAQAQLDAARAAVQRAEGRQLPDVGAGVEYRQNYSSRPAVVPMASITPKVFDTGAAHVAKANTDLRRAEIEADRVRQAAIAETRRALVDLRAQQAVVDAYETRVIELARSNLDLAQEAFDAGATDLTVLLEARRALNDARIELADRSLDATQRRIELERAVGGSLVPRAISTAVAASSPTPDAGATP